VPDLPGRLLVIRPAPASAAAPLEPGNRRAARLTTPAMPGSPHGTGATWPSPSRVLRPRPHTGDRLHASV